MRRPLLLSLALLAFLGAAAPQAHAQPCGLPDAKPLWLDYAEGSVTFRNDVFGRPGIIAATSGTAVPAELRKRGAQTIYWVNKLGSIAGTTSKPADPATIADAANRLVDKATASSGCSTPLIALNELNGPGTTTPWTPTNAQYRANVLALLQAIAARGARPFLLIPSAPYTGGEALDWWRQAAQVAELAPEVYFQAPVVSKLGPLVGSRRMRTAYRQAIAGFTAIGVPTSRLGLVIGFQSGPGTGGREGLQPRSAWLEFVKLQTLAARHVASELGLGSIWTWGWGTFSPASADPDKPAAACVYLWARDTGLCAGPAEAGSDFDASLTAGQILLPSGVQCAVDGRAIAAASIERLATVTRDRDVAFTALFERLVESERVQFGPDRILALERDLITHRFNGSRAAYLSALRGARATLAVARGAIGDALRRAEIERTLPVTPPAGAQIAAFYLSYPATPARLVRARPAPSWLGDRQVGFALSPPAPAEVMSLPLGGETTVVTAAGTFAVQPLEGVLPLGALPLALAAPAIRAALASFARAEAFDAWTTTQQAKALNRAVCLRDDLPSVGAVDPSSFLPFLSLNAGG